MLIQYPIINHNGQFFKKVDMNGKIYSDRPRMEMRNILLETRGKKTNLI